MQIRALTKTGPIWNQELRQIGVKITSKPAPVAKESLSPELSPEELLAQHQVNTVQLRHFTKAESPQLLREDEIPLEEGGQIHLDNLLEALHETSNHFNLENALALHGQTQEWVNDIKQNMFLGTASHDTTYGLHLSGDFGSIEIDLDALQPHKLIAFFLETLGQYSDDELQQHYSALGSHQTVSSAFLENTIQGATLDEKAQELIHIANTLEAELSLAPTPDSPDILELLHEFLTLLQQLDHDLRSIQDHQQKIEHQNKKISDSFSTQLQERLRRLKQQAVKTENPLWKAVKESVLAF